MFLNIQIRNISGINEKIEIDFISKARNRKDLKSVVRTHDNIYINKQLAIIGGNSSGKTSILNSIAQVGSFISAPWDKKVLYEDLQKEDNEVDITSIKKIMRQIGNIVQNVNSENEMSEFKSLMYIVTEDKKTTGYYTYKLLFNRNINKYGVLNESLSYRENYNSKEEIKLIDISGNFESQVGYLVLYHENLRSTNQLNQIENIDYIKAFFNHYINFSELLAADSDLFDIEYPALMLAIKEPQLLRQIIKIIDRDIDDFIVKEESEEEKSLYFINKMNKEVNFKYLSTGTKKMLRVLFEVYRGIKRNGVFVIDEIEMGLHFDLSKLIIRLFYKNDDYSQIIFTTHYPELLDEDFKNDQILYLEKKECNIIASKLIDCIIEGNKVRTDMTFSKLYRNKKIAFQPDEIEIESFKKDFI